MTDTQHWNEVMRASALTGQPVILWGKYLGKVEDTSGARVRVRWDHPSESWAQFTWCELGEVKPFNR